MLTVRTMREVQNLPTTHILLPCWIVTEVIGVLKLANVLQSTLVQKRFSFKRNEMKWNKCSGTCWKCSYGTWRAVNHLLYCNMKHVRDGSKLPTRVLLSLAEQSILGVRDLSDLSSFSPWSLCEGLWCWEEGDGGSGCTVSPLAVSSLWIPASLPWVSGPRLWDEGWIVTLSLNLSCSLFSSTFIMPASPLSGATSSSSWLRKAWGSHTTSGESNRVSRVSVWIKAVRLPREPPLLRRSRMCRAAPTASASAMAM